VMTSWFPPTYYNHIFDHPILWSKDKRRIEEQKLAKECYEVWQNQERYKRSDKLRNQSEVFAFRLTIHHNLISKIFLKIFVF
jgi:hypothetical protein